MNERGFYIPLDNEGPKKPKPPLRTKSPGKRRQDNRGAYFDSAKRDLTTEYVQSIVDQEPILMDDDDDDDDNYGERESGSGNSEKHGGELVIDEKPQLDAVRLR